MTARQAPAAGGPAAGAPDAAAGRRPDSSMSLLVDLMTNTLDLGYAERAARRSATQPSGSGVRATGRLAGVVALVVLGALTGTAVATVRDRAVASAGVRTRLADEVGRRSADSARLQQQAAALRSDVAARRDSALAADDQGRQAADQVRALELAAAVTAVTGPGVVLTVDDAPTPKDSTGTGAGAQRGGTLTDGRVLDRDLQGIVNGLWAAGAEAMAVNGVRLSTRTAIRSAGEAVLVDFRPVSPPYRVEAIGRANALETGFVDGPSGRRLQTLASISGITYSVARADHLRLAAATEPQLRAARPVPEPS